MRKRKTRIVGRTPLVELWDDTGSVSATRGRDLSANDIRELLRKGTIRFVAANVGAPLWWVPQAECFSFWKSELQPHLADPDGEWDLDDYPRGYCYLASEWQMEDGTPVVVLECHH